MYMFSFWHTKINSLLLIKPTNQGPSNINNKKNTVYNVSFVSYGHLGKTIWEKVLR